MQTLKLIQYLRNGLLAQTDLDELFSTFGPGLRYQIGPDQEHFDTDTMLFMCSTRPDGSFYRVGVDWTQDPPPLAELVTALGPGRRIAPMPGHSESYLWEDGLPAHLTGVYCSAHVSDGAIVSLYVACD
jgi:hypothetical protein